MKAALATRPAADLEARYALLEQMAKNTTYVSQASGQSQYLQIQIFEGFMLDTRVTLTYFCLIGLFIYLVVCAVGLPFYSEQSNIRLGPHSRCGSETYLGANVCHHRIHGLSH